MKILLVIGASSDTGRALIDAVAPDYDIIWAHYRTEGKLDALVLKYPDKIRPVRADLSITSEVQAMVDTIAGAGAEPDHIVHIPVAPYIISKFAKTGYCNEKTDML